MSDQFTEEIEVLSSIYGDQLIIAPFDDGPVSMTYSDVEMKFAITLTVPSKYPECQPQCNICYDDKALPPSRKEYIKASVEEIMLLGEQQGDVVIYDTIEKVRGLMMENVTTQDHVFLISEAVDDTDIRDEIPLSKFEDTNSPLGVNVIHGPTTVENLSQFRSHVAKVYSMEEVSQFRSIVLSDRKVARATHNIFAYRFTDPSTGTVHHDCDDDGETAAASRMAEMIRLMGPAVKTTGGRDGGGLAVIVTRWYGGVKLGPDRFKFICNSARRLIEDCEEFTVKNSSNASSNSSNGRKKR